MMNNKKNNAKGRKQTLSVARALAYATSTTVMILAYILIGYFVGRNWGDAGAGIGVAIGGILGLFSILLELRRFFPDADEGNSHKKGEDE